MCLEILNNKHLFTWGKWFPKYVSIAFFHPSSNLWARFHQWIFPFRLINPGLPRMHWKLRPWEKNIESLWFFPWSLKVKCIALRLVFTSDGVGVVKALRNLLKTKNGVVRGVISATSEVRRIKTFPFLPTPLTTPSLTFRLWSSENQIVGVGSRSGSYTPITMHVPTLRDWFSSSLLPPTLTIWFSLGHKRNESGIGTLFAIDHKLRR